MDKRPFLILSVVFVAVIVVGQILAYAPVYKNSSDIWIHDDNDIGYSVTTNTSSAYTAVLFNNGDLYEIDQILIYFDARYPAQHTNSYLEDKIELTISELRLRNSPEVRIVDADEIRAEILSEISVNKYRTAILMMTGVFPDTIYDGSIDSPVIGWLEGGGVLYWIGDPIGMYYVSEGDKVLERHDGYGELFFGTSDDIVAQGELNYAVVPSEDIAIGSALNIHYNITSFGLDASRLDHFISIGYVKDGYDSLVLTKFHSGNGMIVIFGGDASSDAAPILAQVICSRLNYGSSVLHIEKGIVDKGTAIGRIDDIEGATDLYIYLGTPMVIHAKDFDLGQVRS